MKPTLIALAAALALSACGPTAIDEAGMVRDLEAAGITLTIPIGQFVGVIHEACELNDRALGFSASLADPDNYVRRGTRIGLTYVCPDRVPVWDRAVARYR